VTTILIRSIEPQARPAVVELEIAEGEGFSIYLLPDALEGVGDLRSTVIRRQDEHPAEGSLLIADVDVVTDGQEEPQLLVRDLGHLIDLDHVRPGLRSRVLAMTRLGPDARFEVTLPSQRRIEFGLQVQLQGHRMARAALGGAGTAPRSRAKSEAGTLWLLPTAYNLMYDTWDQAFDTAKEIALRLGLSPRMVASLASLMSVIVVSGVVWYQQYKATQDARAQVVQTEEALARSRAGTALALAGEQACLVERKELVDKLGDVAASWQLQIDAALQATSSQGVALEFAGASMARPAVRERDQLSLDIMRKDLAKLLPEIDPPSAEASRCLAFDRLLGPQLPRYALLWHPDPSLACPADYASNLSGGWSVGRWGLSARAAREFGVVERAEGYEDLEPGGDSRANDRWAANVLVDGLIASESALLGWHGAGRVPVAPSQAQLWALTLWHGYNAMPSPTEGVLDQPLSVCIDELLDDLNAEASPAAPGVPLLPDLLPVANGKVSVRARPTPGCPWPSDVLTDGAQAAVRAVGRAAHVATVESEDAP